VTSTAGTSPHQSPDTPLADALEKNQQAPDELRQAAEDVAAVGAVLDAEAANVLPDEEASTQAVAEISSIEMRLARSAEKLDQVNKALEKINAELKK
jgi:septal ring factor EnvC (AmiA/AmiB activator)